ncbi:MAG: hypothetical protein IT518_09905 [Burkholderiales bacterium]|nr:hypothetical protein [Burkholderiales bacterium]
MESLTAPEADPQFRSERRAPPRRVLGGIVVAALYALMLVGAPLIVRYGPEPEVSAAVARVADGEAGTPRCAYAPEPGRSCMPEAPAPRIKGKAVFTE